MKCTTSKILDGLLSRQPALEACRKDIAVAFETLLAAYRSGGKVLACGNGGSATEVMRAVGGRSIALTGQAASRLSDVCDVAIRVPETETFRVQELHLPVYHALCAMLEEELF